MSFTRTGDFVLVRKGRHSSSSPLLTPVAVSLLYDRSKDNDPAKGRRNKLTTIAVRVIGGIVEELEWQPHQYIEVHEGTGTSGGKLLLRPADMPEVGYKLSYSSHAPNSIGKDGRLVTTGVYPACTVKVGAGGLYFHTIAQGEVHRSITSVEYRAYNNELLVTMPTWFVPSQENLRRVRRAIEHDRAESTTSNRRGRGNSGSTTAR